MTRRELSVWIMSHQGCEIEQLPEGKARVIKYFNRATFGHAFLDSPIDDTQLKEYTVYKICSLLGIEIPPGISDLKSVDDAIESLPKRGVRHKIKYEKEE